MDLLKKRESLVADHRSQQKHDPHYKQEEAAARARGEPYTPLAERPLAFLCDDEVVVVGACAAKVLAGLRAFEEKWKAAVVTRETPEGEVRVNTFDERGAREPHFAQALKVCRATLAAPPAAELRFGQQRWNAVLACLSEVGLVVCLADGGA